MPSGIFHVRTGRVLTRPMISDHVWNQDFRYTFTNVIDVYVNYLRNKNRPRAGAQAFSIHTIRGGICSNWWTDAPSVRLTLWYGTALAWILLTFSVVLYTITARSLRDQVDESLQETASAAVRSLETRGLPSSMKMRC